jgi:hypothetical protein
MPQPGAFPGGPTPQTSSFQTVSSESQPKTVSTPLFTSTTTAPPKSASRVSRRNKIIGIVVIILLLVGGTTAFLVALRTNQTGVLSVTANNFNPLSIPLAELASHGQISLKGETLNINGQLRTNGSLIMTPAAQPATPSTGQIYYDQTSNHLSYYNGTEFVQIQTNKDASGTSNQTVNNINNITNLTVTTSSPQGGTTNRIAKFTSGQTLGDSILTDNSTFVGVNGGINITAASSTADLSFWPNNNTPANIDNADKQGSLDLGVKFQVDVPGVIKSVRFYKASADGAFTANLWTSAGTLLAQTVINANGIGWKTATFNSPVTISPDTTYVASYHITSAPGNVIGYPYDLKYFGSSSVDNGPLHALASGLDGGNGVFTYSNTPAMPSQTFNSSNYWVDVDFSGSQFTTDSRIRVNGAQLSSSDLANDSNLAKRGSTQIFSGHNIFRNANDSVDEFSIQQANTTPLLTADSLSGRIYIGPVTGGGSILLVLNNRIASGDPSNPTDGAMYFHAIDGVFRCYGNNAWSNCNDPQPSRSFTVYDEFLGGQTTSFGTNNIIGSLGWNAQAIGANGGINFNPATPTPSADRPGVLGLTTPAVANQGTTMMLGNANGGSSIIQRGNVVRTAVAVGAATGQVLRVGLHTETASTTQPVSGMWWEADPVASANWRYCYGNGTTAVCANSSVPIAANTWVRLSIIVNATGTGTSDVSFAINGVTPYEVSNVTIDSATRVSPALTCYGTDGSAHSCFWDYYEYTGNTSAAR